MKRNRILKTWQTDPGMVKTDHVQFWQNGVMVTGQMKLEKAQTAVREGTAFVMTEQAIGALVNGLMAS